MSTPTPPPDDAAALLALLAPGEPLTFQTFGEGPNRGTRGLTRILHGTLGEHAAELASLNARGAGVFWMVNAGDGKGRRAPNVLRVRAFFVDLDGAPLEPVTSSSLRPHAIVESSPNRWHAYWRVLDCPLEQFNPLQQALAARFGADLKVCDLPRVLRLPGFDHCKHERYRSRVVELHPGSPFNVAEFRHTLNIHAAATPPPAANVARLHARRRLPDRIAEGERNDTLMRLAGGLVRKGFSLAAVTHRLQRINAERCVPPLGADEVDIIATHAIGYGSSGYTTVAHRMEDSLAWHALNPQTRDLVRLAFRRYNGSNNGNIALTFEDFREWRGHGSRQAFYRNRDAAIAAGFLQQTGPGHMTQSGRTPFLFAIRPQWLPECRKVSNGNLAHGTQPEPLHIQTGLHGVGKRGREATSR